MEEWLSERREALGKEVKERKAEGEKVELREVLERRLEMNEEVRPFLADVRPLLPSSFFSHSQYGISSEC